MALTKVSGDILDTGIVVAGVVTATSFDGPITGNVTGSATSISGTPDITVRNISGVGATFTGNVSIGGTLTYQDVTNVDSTGIATARVGLDILSGGLNIVGLTTGLHVSGVSTFTGAINGDVTGDVTGTASNASGATGDFSIADKIIHTGDTNTAIRFPAADTFTVETAGDERLRIDSNGRVLIGGTSSLNQYGSQSYLQVQGTGYDDSTIALRRDQNNANPPGIVFAKSRAGSLGGNTIVQDDDQVGSLVFAAADGTDLTSVAAEIKVEIDGTPGSNDVPGRIVFATTADGASSAIEKLRITSAGNLKLPDDGKIEFGGAQSGAGDLQIYHAAGADSTIHHTATSGSTLRLRSRGFTFKNQANSQTIATFNEGDACKLFFSGGEKLATTGTGISVTGKVVASGEIEAAQDYPIIKPSLHLNFAATKSLDPRIKYYRHGPASYVDQTGRVVLVGENIPRFDHDPATRECKGLLVEEAKTNHAIHSTTLLNSAYNYLNSTKVGYSATAPDGTNNATLMYPSSSGSGRGIEDIYTLPSSGKWTTSVYVKSAGLSWVRLYGVNGSAVAWFNVSTGAKGGNTGSPVDYDIIDAGNGWYRIWLTYNLTTIGGTEYFYIYFSDADNSTTVTANGTNGIYMWGLQVERSDFLTSYIPTYGFTQTRGADNAFMDAIDDSFYSQDEGTAIIEYNYNEDSDGAHTLFAFTGRESDPDSSNPRQWLRINKTAGTARAIRYSLTTDAGSSSDDSSAVATPGQWDKFAFAYTAGDQDLYLNGSSINDLSRTPPTNCYRLSFGNAGWALGTETIMLEGHIRRFMYYPKKLPNSQLGTITS